MFESLGSVLSRHRAVSRVSLTALSFTIVLAMSQQAAPATQAGPETAPAVPESLLPLTLGIGLATESAITIPFESPMDRASVEAALQVLPAQAVEVSWNDDSTLLSVRAETRWRTDERYLIVIGGDATASDGAVLGSAERYAFSTETAPVVRDVQVNLVGVEDGADGDAAKAATLKASDMTSAGTHETTETADGVSATTSIAISFSAPMDQADTEAHFAVQPEVEGDLDWVDGDLVFTPTGRLEPGARYTISVIGAHDADGNALGGKANFSFVVRPGAQITKTVPEHKAMNVDPTEVEIWFSQPMDVEAVEAAFTLTDTNIGQEVAGSLSWNPARTQLVYTPDSAFVAGHTFGVTLGDGAKDADGNAITADWYFTTTAPAPEPVRAPTTTRSAPSTPSAPSIPPPGPATSLAGYALNQVNAARAAYGFAPVVLDASISAVASAHAWDQARNGYFSHTGRNGSTRESRLRAGGVSFGYSGENQCYYNGMSEQATLDWCHAQFMAEPYPGHWNHIANILDPRFHRMGVGIASVGGRTVITWNFTD